TCARPTNGGRAENEGPGGGIIALDFSSSTTAWDLTRGFLSLIFWKNFFLASRPIGARTQTAGFSMLVWRAPAGRRLVLGARVTNSSGARLGTRSAGEDRVGKLNFR